MIENQNHFLPEGSLWMLEMAIGILGVIILSFLAKKMLQMINKKKTKKNLGSKLYMGIYTPLQVAIWGFAIAYSFEVIALHFNLVAVAKYVHPLKTVFIVICFSWIVLRANKHAFEYLAAGSENLGISLSTVLALKKLAIVILSILIGMILFQVLGLNITPLLTVGGIGMAGIAFAAQDVVANFFGGVMLHFTRIFSIGDYIVIPAQNNFEGRVKEIGWYITTMEDPLRRVVYFPNALFSKSQVINDSRRTHRRIEETVVIRQCDVEHLSEIVETLKEKIKAHPDIDSSDAFMVALSKIGINGLEIYLSLLVRKMGLTQFMQVKQEVLQIVEEVVSQHKAEFANPTTNVFLTQTISKQKEPK